MRKLNFALFALLCAMLITSCTGGSSTEKILRAIPDDATMVVVADINTIIESAGGSIDGGKLKLPSDIADIAGDDIDVLNDMLKNGLDPAVCAIAIMDLNSDPIFVGMLKDKKKFIDYIEDNGYREKDNDNDATYYSKLVYESSYSADYNDYSYIAVTDSYVYYIERVWVGSSIKPIKVLSRMIEDAAESSFIGNPVAGYITEGNAGGIALKIPRDLRKELRDMGLSSETLDLLDGYICYKGTLSDQEATLEMKFFDEDGKSRDLSSLNKYYDLSAKINTRALSYLGKDEVLAGAIAFNDVKWDALLDMIPTSAMSTSDRMMMVGVKEYLSKIDGTVAFGVGPTNGIESLLRLNSANRLDDCLSFTAVIEVKEGKAKGVIKDAKALMDAQGIDYISKDNGFSLTIPGVLSLYAKYEDNLIIISSNPIKDSGKNPVAAKIDFSRQFCVIGLVLNSDCKFMRDLNLDNDLQMSLEASPKDMEYVLRVKVKDGKGGILSRLIRIGLDIASQKGRIQSLCDELSPASYQDPYCVDEDYALDDEVVDSVYVEEVEVIE